MKRFNDNYGNIATIEEKMILPYKDSLAREKGYILTLTAAYDNDFVYFVSIYETEKQAMNKLKEFSCNTWKEE